MAESKYITLMLIPEGTESRRGFRMRTWVFRFAIGAFIALLVGIILFFVFYGKVLTRAALADKLEKENERLLRYQYKVHLLESNLKQAREIVTRVTELAGIDIEFPELPDDSTLFATLDEKGMAVVSRASGLDFSIPSGLPIQGFITQDFEVDNMSQYHPGVDIACAEGTPVLATASGEVIYAGFDSAAYGYVVIVQHSDSVTTLYGHNRELLVQEGQTVLAGGRVAMSGSTGKSTAPHLHYEIRINDKPIDPLGNWYDQKR
ncbi:MAG: M23 family metallopeptidase [Candidatus Zixiibacteriota bacterium]|nr:MAG: M23 family metallopeptidase [candidate division Zixibacteria bacterium]